MVGYKNPPIVEAVCEFRFSKNTVWNSDIPSKLYEKIKDEFPNTEIRNEQHIEIKATKKGGIEESNLESVDRCVYLNNERKILIQIAPRMISISCLKPYPSWEVFKQKIKLAYDTLGELTEINEIDRIGLAYVDKIEIPEEPVKLKEYFKFYPHLSNELPQVFGNFIIGCDFIYNEGRDLCRLQLTKAMPGKKENNAFLLTTDYFTAKINSVKPIEAINWIEKAHIELKQIFIGCITEKLEDLFNKED